jgi:pimeloyl-ACP methyl ester carboxylesterase
MKTVVKLMSIVLSATFVVGCGKNPVDPTVNGDPLDTSQFIGTGSFVYTPTGFWADKDMNIYYHIPESATTETPIMFLFHGNTRDAESSRNQLISKANDLNVILLTPEFSMDDFSTNNYHLGHLFSNGENPSAATLNLEEEWTYTIIEPLFEYFVQAIGSDQLVFDAFGHSAGGQFAHRMALFVPSMKYRRVCAAASGWYTFPDTTISFPYGLEVTPRSAKDLVDVYSRNVTIIVGSLDTDPNSAGLRNTSEAVAQGENRLERGQNFYNYAAASASNLNSFFNWDFYIVPNVAHSFQGNGHFAMEQFYNP